MMMTSFATSASDAAADLRDRIQGADTRTLVATLLAMVCLGAPFDLTQLALVVAGAGAYALFLQPLRFAAPPPRPSQKGGGPPHRGGVVPPVPRKVVPSPPPMGKYLPPAMRSSNGGLGGVGGAPSSSCGARAMVRRAPVAALDSGKATAWPRAAARPPAAAARAPTAAPALGASVHPIEAPTFEAVGFDAQVAELVKDLAPTRASDEAVERLAERVRRALRSLLPEAGVEGFASCGALRGRAFGVAVPDVDLVVRCDPAALAARFPSANGPRTDRRQLSKAALRAFVDHLVGSGRFKFRRSAFNAEEPKVTLLATDGADPAGGIPVDLCLNTSTPVHNAALIAECGRLDDRARGLILLVRRWARDRGICYAARGHLAPYCWTLLAIYFLQVGAEEGEPQVLPALAGFTDAAGGGRATPVADKKGQEADGRSVGSLFRGFAAFYARRFNARAEAVSVRLGRRAPPSMRLPLHIVVDEDGERSDVAPSIEDPFDEARNLAQGLSALGLARLREEFARAASLLSAEGGEGAQDASLTELLMPWAPEE